MRGQAVPALREEEKLCRAELELCAPAEEGAGYQGLPEPSSAYQDLPYAFRDWMDGVMESWTRLHLVSARQGGGVMD